MTLEVIIRNSKIDNEGTIFNNAFADDLTFMARTKEELMRVAGRIEEAH